MQYCKSQTDASLWRIVAVASILLHVVGLWFLEGYCQILPSPHHHESSSSCPKRPAVYLLKIVSGIAMAFVSLPVVIKVSIPNMMSAANSIFGFDIGSERALARDVPNWACDAEVIASTILFTSYIFEIFAFRGKQSKDIWLHHVLASFFAMARVVPSSLPAMMDSEWLWWALMLHLTFSSLNIVRPCQSFLKHYLASRDYARLQNLKALFYGVNVGVWGLNLCAYYFAALVEVMRSQGSLWSAFFCVVAPIPMMYGSLKEILSKEKKSVSLDSSSARLLFRMVFEIGIGLTLAPILLFLDYLFPAGMKKFTHKSSHKNTAGGVVLLRALCYSESWDRRLFLDDPFALRFVTSRISRGLLRSCMLRYIVSLKLEAQHPGALGHMITRTKTIDESLADLTSRVYNPVRQLVILGAGYDTRAYRLQSLKDVVVFEVDQSFMSLEKQKKCADLKPLCRQLVHLSTDFNKESVEDVLGACDKFDPSKPTYFLWEGVQVYLSDKSVDRVFASIRRMHQSGGNSIQYLYFTFSDKAIMTPQGRANIYGGEEFYEYALNIGEQVQSGIEPSNVQAYLSDRGFAPYIYESRSGLSGHMTPEQKQNVHLSTHPFVRQSEVFHSCLVCNASQTRVCA